MGNYCVVNSSCCQKTVSIIIPVSSSQIIKNEINSSLLKRSISPHLPEEDFESKVVNEINSVRTAPKTYANKLKGMMSQIQHEGNITYLALSNKEKVVLRNGEEPFISTIEYISSIKPMKALILNQELRVNISNKNKKGIKNKQLEELMVKKRIEMLARYNKIQFTIDFISNPILSVMLQLIDESFKHERRNILLNQSFSYCAVSYTKDSRRQFISIITLSGK